MLPVCLGDFGLSRAVGWYNRSDRGLYRDHMGRSVGAERFVLSVGYDKDQMSQIVPVVGA